MENKHHILKEQLKRYVSDLEQSNITNDEKINKDFNNALHWGYVEAKAVNLSLIGYYNEIIEALDLENVKQIDTKEYIKFIIENNIENLLGIDFYQHTTIQIRKAKVLQEKINTFNYILKFKLKTI